MIFGVLLGGAFVVVAIVLLVWARGGWDAVRRLRAVQRRPIRELHEGAVEISGVVRLAGPDEPVLPPSGRPAVAMHLKVTAFRGNGKNRVVVHRQEIERRVPTLITDDAGGVALLDFENVEIVAPTTGVKARQGVFSLAALAWVPSVPGGADSIVLEERIIEVGEHVMVSGHARIREAVIEHAAAPGYRDGVPTTRTSFLVHGSPTARLIIGPGSERQLLFRAGWPVVLLVGAAAVSLAYAALLFVVAAS
ncbi:MAG: hypothetical protein JWP97_362 [Labilithrix sp.]|nr:hypothetical protein [Labilithrix sp.]